MQWGMRFLYHLVVTWFILTSATCERLLRPNEVGRLALFKICFRLQDTFQAIFMGRKFAWFQDTCLRLVSHSIVHLCNLIAPFSSLLDPNSCCRLNYSFGNRLHKLHPPRSKPVTETCFSTDLHFRCRACLGTTSTFIPHTTSCTSVAYFRNLMRKYKSKTNAIQ
jgi:hypothetical protein